jgi:hypothetical protein
MLVPLVILFLIIIGLIVAYYMGYLDQYINPEESPPPLVPEPVIAPVIAPESGSASASAVAPVTAGAPTSSDGVFPADISGLSGRYTTEGFNDSTNSWADQSPMQNHIIDVKGDLNIDQDYVYGSKTVGLKFPIEIFGKDDVYTMFYVARYNGSDKKRIFDGTNNNWLSGFYNGKTGIAHHKDWLTNRESIHGSHPWIIATDAPNKFRTFGEDRVVNKSVYNTTSQITVNMGQYDLSQSSDWAIKEVIFYNRLLTLNEISRVESYLIKKYRSELPEDVTAAQGYVTGDKRVEDPRPVPYGYGTQEFCRQQAISLGYPVWGHRSEKATSVSNRNKCFYYTDGAFDDFNEDDEDEVHTMGCTDPQKDIFSGCSE